MQIVYFRDKRLLAKFHFADEVSLCHFEWSDSGVEKSLCRGFDKSQGISCSVSEFPLRFNSETPLKTAMINNKELESCGFLIPPTWSVVV